MAKKFKIWKFGKGFAWCCGSGKNIKRGFAKSEKGARAAVERAAGK